MAAWLAGRLAPCDTHLTTNFEGLNAAGLVPDTRHGTQKAAGGRSGAANTSTQDRSS